MKAFSRKSLRAYLSQVFVCILVSCLAISLASCSCSKQEEAVAEESTLTVNDSPAPEVEEKKTWPLTGLPLGDNDDPSRRPLSVKIENSPDARPQTGLSHADVVYESVTEGGITRFNAIFHSDIPAELGPVRSARNSDVSIVPQYKALFFYSGANSTVFQQLKDAKIANMSHTPAQELYYRVDYRYAPHNLYIKTENVYGVAAGRELKTNLDIPPTLEFGNTDTSSAAAATNVKVPLSDYYVADWTYDEAAKTYARSMDGASLDAEADQPIVANNVVIMWAPYVAGVIANGSQTYNVDLTTNGNASIFMNGKCIDGTWEATAETPPRFKDTSGNQILLTAGKTWIEVIDPSIPVTFS